MTGVYPTTPNALACAPGATLAGANHENRHETAFLETSGFVSGIIQLVWPRPVLHRNWCTDTREPPRRSCCSILASRYPNYAHHHTSQINIVVSKAKHTIPALVAFCSLAFFLISFLPGHRQSHLPRSTTTLPCDYSIFRQRSSI